MSKIKINSTDKLVHTVIKKFDDRSSVGQKKYGIAMQDEVDRDLKSLGDFVNDVQEELMDAILYLEAVKQILEKKGLYDIHKCK